jgi:transcriptional regulator with XRE-family HTH domain
MNHYDQLTSKAQTTEEIAQNAHEDKMARISRRRGRVTTSAHDELQLRQAGARLLERRKQLGFSVNHMAVCLDVTGPCYRQWENKFGNLAQTKYLENVAAVMGVDPAWISLGQNSPPDKSQTDAKTSVSRWRVAPPGLSMEERQEYAKRALLRRKALKISLDGLTKLMGIPGLTAKRMRKMEAYLPVVEDAAIEARWERVLNVPAGWIRNKSIEEKPVSELTGQLSMAHASTIADEILGVSAWLARSKLPARTANFDELEDGERRGAQIFATRYGVKGESESTLQAIADSVGLTRQRIEQITLKMRERSGSLEDVDPPLIARLRRELTPLLPQTVANLDLHFKDLLGESLSLVGVERFAQDVLKRSILTITGKPTSLQTPWEPVAVDPNTHDADVLRVIRDAAMAMIRNVGAAQVEFIAGAAAGATGKGVTPSKVIEVIHMVPGFEWLLERDGWFWLGEKYENRLLNLVKKVLAVAGRRVDIEDIHGAMARARRVKTESTRTGSQSDELDTVPIAASIRAFTVEAPYAVLVCVLKKLSWLEQVQYDDFRLREPIPLESILSMVELAVYEFLSNKGGLASRFDIQQALLEVPKPDFTPIALHAALDASPIFTRIDTGIFALRGVSLTAEAFAAASRSVGGSSNTKHYASLVTDKHGYITFPMTVASYMLNAGYFGLPRQLAVQLPLGEFSLEGVLEPITLSKLSSNGEYRLLKFAKHLVAAGLKAGDRITLSVNPQTRQLKWAKSSKTARSSA